MPKPQLQQTARVISRRDGSDHFSRRLHPRRGISMQPREEKFFPAPPPPHISKARSRESLPLGIPSGAPGVTNFSKAAPLCLASRPRLSVPLVKVASRNVYPRRDSVPSPIVSRCLIADRAADWGLSDFVRRRRSPLMTYAATFLVDARVSMRI